MESKHKVDPLIVIVGETASGKSALALEVAERYNGELICADSRTVYRGMDIGTAKPSKIDQLTIPHYLLDILEPNETFNVGEFKKRANKLLLAINKRGNIPVIVGGTGLYIDSVLYDFGFSVLESVKDEINPRHLKEATNYSRSELRSNTLILGINVPKDELEQRIIERVTSMFSHGLEYEVRGLATQFGWGAEAMTGVGYREWQAYFEGNQTLDETRELITIHTRQYAKRQRSWFKRNDQIKWVSNQPEALRLIAEFLSQVV